MLPVHSPSILKYPLADDVTILLLPITSTTAASSGTFPSSEIIFPSKVVLQF